MFRFIFGVANGYFIARGPAGEKPDAMKSFRFAINCNAL